uniref:Uncharacterized protein n=1 Tax=Anguilla anguilla TaxID=7936 RepID=A0A0E9XBQ9_ANGAN
MQIICYFVAGQARPHISAPLIQMYQKHREALLTGSLAEMHVMVPPLCPFALRDLRYIPSTVSNACED